MIWANFFGSFTGKPYTFPFTNNEGLTFTTQGELLEYITDKYGHEPSQSLFYSALYEFCAAELIWDSEIQSWIDKYYLCREFSIPAFPGAFDDYPAYWVDFMKIMASELNKCMEEQRRKSGNS